MIKYTKKRNEDIEPFQMSKIQRLIDFAVKGTGLSAIEYESILNFPNKETIESKLIQEQIINSGRTKIDINDTRWDLAVGRADMYQLYRGVHKSTKLEPEAWQEHIKYLVRNNYYREDILEFLNRMTEKEIKFIDKIIKDEEKNNDWNQTFAQVEMLKAKYLIKNKRGIIEYPILSDIVNTLILTKSENGQKNRFQKMFRDIHYQYISLATPFKRNLRRPDGNVGSCFIGETPDSLTALMKGFTDMALISKNGGGIGWYLGKIRPEDTYSYKIVKSNNITKWAKIINDIAVAVNQSGCVEKNTMVEVLRDTVICTIEIKDVQKGDLINSFNIETEKQEFKEVLGTFKPEVKHKDQIKIEFSDSESYITSNWHPTLIYKNGEYIYVKAEEIKINDITINSLNEKVQVTKIDNNPLKEEDFVDITVKDNNNYFCSKDGDIFHVVHNTRPGAITLALDWWHLDMPSFLDIKSELKGDLRDKAFDIFPQVVVDQHFLKAVKEDKDVWMFNHYEYKKLTGTDVTECIEDELLAVHKHIEELAKTKFKKFTKKISAKKLWKDMLWMWIEIGDAYICNKDKLNFSNYMKYDPDGGVAKCANLCMTGDTEVQVKLQDEEKTIRLDEVRPGHQVKSFNTDTNAIEYKNCYEFLDMGVSTELIEIEDELKNTIRCTPDHKIFTVDRDYVLAEDLLLTDTLIVDGSITKIKEIRTTKTKEKIYDINIEDNHNFFANGILVHNCQESWSFTKPATKWKEESDLDNRITTETNGLSHSCNLISIVMTNLVGKTDEFIAGVVDSAVYALDVSIDEGTSPVLEADNMSRQIRNVGLGAVGVADYMAYNNKLYDTDDGLLFLEQMTEKLSYYAYRSSIQLAKDYSPYPLFKKENYTKILGRDPEELNELSLNGFDWVQLKKDILEHGIRNFYLLAFAPNSGTGILMGAVASYLPAYNKEMVQTLGEMSLPILPRFINEKYWYYKTKFQYHPRVVINATSRMQKWIDTGLSMEMNITPEGCKINEVSDALIDAFLYGDLKTVYYSMTIEGGCSDCGN